MDGSLGRDLFLCQSTWPCHLTHPKVQLTRLAERSDTREDSFQKCITLDAEDVAVCRVLV